MKRFLAILAGVAVALLTAVSLLSWLGMWSGKADLLSHFRLHYAAFALATSLVALTISRRLALIAAVLTAVNGAGAAVYPVTQPAEPGPGPRLKIITLNTLYFSRNTETIERFVRSERPDLVLLQELKPAKQHLLAALRDILPYRADCGRKPRCDTAVLSRYPLPQHGTVRLGQDGASATWAAVAVPGQRLLAVSVHLKWPFVSDQRGQLEDLSDLVLRSGLPTVIAGDFNATPWSGVMRRFSAQSGLKAAGTFTPTWPAQSFSQKVACRWCIPQLQIDHILLGGEFRLLEHKSGPNVGSDHLPLIATVQLVARQAG